MVRNLHILLSKFYAINFVDFELSRFIAMMQDYDRTLELVDKAQNSNGKSTEQFAKYQDTLAAKWQTFLTTLEQITHSEGLTEFLKNTVDWMNKVAEKMSKLSPKTLIAEIVAGIATIKTLLNNIPKMALNISGLITNSKTGNKLGLGNYSYDYQTRQVKTNGETDLERKERLLNQAHTARNQIETNNEKIARINELEEQLKKGRNTLGNQEAESEDSLQNQKENEKKKLFKDEADYEQQLIQETEEKRREERNKSHEELMNNLYEEGNIEKQEEDNSFDEAEIPELPESELPESLESNSSNSPEVEEPPEMLDFDVDDDLSSEEEKSNPENDEKIKQDAAEETAKKQQALDDETAKKQQALEDEIANKQQQDDKRLATQKDALIQENAELQKIEDNAVSLLEMTNDLKVSEKRKASLAMAGNLSGIAMSGATAGLQAYSGYLNSDTTKDYVILAGIPMALTAVTQLVSGNWIGAVVTAATFVLGAVAKIILGLIKVKKQLAEAYDLTKKQQLLENSQEKLEQQVSTAKADVQESKEKVKTLLDAVDTYNKLKNKVSLTEEEQEEYNDMVSTIRDQYPEIILSYDSINNKIVLNVSKEKEMLDTQREETEELIRQEALSTARYNSAKRELAVYKNIDAELGEYGDNLGANLLGGFGNGSTYSSLNELESSSVEEIANKMADAILDDEADTNSTKSNEVLTAQLNTAATAMVSGKYKDILKGTEFDTEGYAELLAKLAAADYKGLLPKTISSDYTTQGIDFSYYNDNEVVEIVNDIQDETAKTETSVTDQYATTSSFLDFYMDHEEEFQSAYIETAEEANDLAKELNELLRLAIEDDILTESTQYITNQISNNGQLGEEYTGAASIIAPAVVDLTIEPREKMTADFQAVAADVDKTSYKDLNEYITGDLLKQLQDVYSANTGGKTLSLSSMDIIDENGNFKGSNSKTITYELMSKTPEFEALMEMLGITDEDSFTALFGSAADLSEIIEAIGNYAANGLTQMESQDIFDKLNDQNLIPAVNKLESTLNDMTMAQYTDKLNAIYNQAGIDTTSIDEELKNLGLDQYYEELKNITDVSKLNISELQSMGGAYEDVFSTFSLTYNGDTKAAEEDTINYFNGLKEDIIDDIDDPTYKEEILNYLFGLDPSSFKDKERSEVIEEIREWITTNCEGIGEEAAEGFGEHFADYLSSTNLGINLNISTTAGALDIIEKEIEKISNVTTLFETISGKIQSDRTVKATDVASVQEAMNSMGLTDELQQDVLGVTEAGEYVINYEKLEEYSRGMIKSEDEIKKEIIELIDAEENKLKLKKATLLALKAELKNSEEITKQNVLQAAIQASGGSEEDLNTYLHTYATQFGFTIEDNGTLTSNNEDTAATINSIDEAMSDIDTQIEEDEKAKQSVLDSNMYSPEAFDKQIEESANDYIKQWDDTIQLSKDDAEDAEKAVYEAQEALDDANESLEEANQALKEAKEGTDEWIQSIEGLINYTTRLDRIQLQLTNNSTDLKNTESIEDSYAALSLQEILRQNLSNLLTAENQKYQNAIQENLTEFQTGNWEGTSYSQFLQLYDDGSYGIDALSLQDAKIPDDIATELNDMISNMNEYTNNILQNENTIAELEQTRLSEHKQYLSDYVSLQDKVADTLKENAEEEIETEKNKYSAMEEAQNDYLDALEKAISKQKELRDEEDSYNDLAQQEAKLSLMERDTSNSNSSIAEISELRLSVQESRESLLDSKIDNIVSNLKDIYETQKEERDALLEIKELVISDSEEEGIFTLLASEVVASFGSVEDVQAWFMENDSNLNGKTVEAIEKEMLDIKDSALGAFNYQAELQLLSDANIENSVTTTTDYLQATAETLTGKVQTDMDITTKSVNEAIADAEEAVKDAEKTVTDAEQDLEDKQKAYADSLAKIEDDAKTAKDAIINYIGELENKSDKNGNESDKNTESKTGQEKIWNTLSAAGVSDKTISAAKTAYSQSGGKLSEVKRTVKNSGELSDTAYTDMSNKLDEVAPDSTKPLYTVLGKNKIKYEKGIGPFSGAIYFPSGCVYNPPLASAYKSAKTALNQYISVIENGAIPLNEEGNEISNIPSQYSIKFGTDLLFRIRNNEIQYKTSTESDDSFKPTGLKVSQYAKGGLVDYTGPAWVDGTKSAPEAFLSSTDTQNIQSLTSVLDSLFNKVTINSGTADNIANSVTNNTQNNGENTFNINLDIGSVSNDYDVEDMITKMKEEIVNAANPIGANTMLYR